MCNKSGRLEVEVPFHTKEGSQGRGLTGACLITAKARFSALSTVLVSFASQPGGSGSTAHIGCKECHVLAVECGMA
jgi:hypothetical protein